MNKFTLVSASFITLIFSTSILAHTAISVKNKTQHTIKVLGQNKKIPTNNNPNANWYWVKTGLSLKIGSHTLAIYDDHISCAKINSAPPPLPIEKNVSIMKRNVGWYMSLYIDGNKAKTICAINGTERVSHAEIKITKHKSINYAYLFTNTGIFKDFKLDKNAKLQATGDF